MAYAILTERCDRRGLCLSACPMGAISREDDRHCVIDPEVCTDCGTCADICPAGAIVGAEALEPD